MTILAIDQASGTSGFAWGTPEKGCLGCGVINTKSRFVDVGGQMLLFERKLKDLITAAKPTCIAFESHRAHTGVIAAQMLGGVSAIVMKVAREHQIPYIGVDVPTWKKAFTGTPRATKQLVLAVAQKKYPHLYIKSHDTADALGILHGAFSKL